MKAITESTPIRLTIVVAIVGFAWWLGAQVTTIQRDISDIRAAVAIQWSRQDMEHWTTLLRVSNPTLTIPETTKPN